HRPEHIDEREQQHVRRQLFFGELHGVTPPGRGLRLRHPDRRSIVYSHPERRQSFVELPARESQNRAPSTVSCMQASPSEENLTIADDAPAWRALPTQRSFSPQFLELRPRIYEWIEDYYDRDHLTRAGDWMLALAPEAPEYLVVAALLHDLER